MDTHAWTVVDETEGCAVAQLRGPVPREGERLVLIRDGEATVYTVTVVAYVNSAPAMNWPRVEINVLVRPSNVSVTLHVRG